jgi:hypothetical protein
MISVINIVSIDWQTIQEIRERDTKKQITENERKTPDEQVTESLEQRSKEGIEEEERGDRCPLITGGGERESAGRQ